MLQYMSHMGSSMKNILENRENLYPEVDYQALMAQMQGYSHPRRKLKEMQKKGYLLRLKKGFYVLTRELIDKDYSVQIIANTLYGPSYLSLEYALAYYALIPERVDTITSVTSQKNKGFETPLGLFTYRHLSSALYPIGVMLHRTADERSYLMATPEKALMDIFTLKFDKADLPSSMDIRQALEEDLRIDMVELKKIIRIEELRTMKFHYRNRRWNKQLIDFLLESL